MIHAFFFPEDGGGTFSETMETLYQNTRRHKPEDSNLNGSCGGNLRSHKYFPSFMSLPSYKLTILDEQVGEELKVHIRVLEHRMQAMAI
jgi:hypothetical protein